MIDKDSGDCFNGKYHKHNISGIIVLIFLVKHEKRKNNEHKHGYAKRHYPVVVMIRIRNNVNQKDKKAYDMDEPYYFLPSFLCDSFDFSAKW